MRSIIRRREIVRDELRYGGEALEEGTVRVYTLADWLQAARLTPSAAAVLLGATDELEALAAYLQPVRWIVIDFAKIGEGRGYSQARLLRQRYRYAFELRARGAIKRDQLFFLARCGFDAFDLEPGEDLSAALAAFDSFTVAYQDGTEDLLAPRRRASADAQPRN
jgi:uncharacterized protein (DUF934 family)